MSFGYQILGFGSFPSRDVPISATGGTIVTSGGFKYHTFTSSGTFAVSAGTGDIEVLMVAGGGGGGRGHARSGGGGGGKPRAHGQGGKPNSGGGSNGGRKQGGKPGGHRSGNGGGATPAAARSRGSWSPASS